MAVIIKHIKNTKLLLFFVLTFVYTGAYSSNEAIRTRLTIIEDSLELPITFNQKKRLFNEVEQLTKEKQDIPEFALKYFSNVIHIAYLKLNSSSEDKEVLDYSMKALEELEKSKIPQKDSLKVEIEILQSSCYNYLKNYEKSEEVLLSIIENKESIPIHKVKAYKKVAIIYYKLNNLKVAFDYINKAISNANYIQDTSIIVSNYVIKSNLLYAKKNYIKANMVLDTAIRLLPGANYYFQATVYSKKAKIYLITNDYKQALSLNKKGLRILEDNQISPISTAIFNLDIADIYLKSKLYDSAFVYAKKVLKINLEKRPRLKIHAYLYISQYFYQNNNIDSVRYYLNKGQAILTQKKIHPSAEKYNQALLHYYFAKMHQKENNYKVADAFIDSCFRFDFENKSNFFESYIEMYSTAATIKKAVNKHKESIDFLDKSIVLLGQTNKNKLNSLIMKNKLEDDFQKERMFLLNKEKEQRKKKKDALLIMVFSFVIIILFIFFTIKLKTFKMNTKLLQVNNKFGQAQIAPHFVTNALANIQSKIKENKNVEAKKMIKDFSDLSNLLLMSVREKSVTLEQEIELINKYIYFQKLKEDTFDFEIKVPENIEKEKIKIPPLISQPFIENAIEHGLLNKKERGFIKISYSLNKMFIKIDIEDNGVGMSIKEMENQKIKTYQIVNERLIFFNQKFQENQFHIGFNSIKNKGTKITIQTPYNQVNTR